MQSFNSIKNLIISNMRLFAHAKVTRLILVGLLPILLIHCAPQDQANMLERRVNGLSADNRSLSNQVKGLRQELNVLRETAQKTSKQDIASVRSRQAELANRMEELQAELLRLNGLIDQMVYRNEREDEEKLRFRNDIKEQVDKLREDVKLLHTSANVAKKVEQARKKAAQGAVDLYQQALDLIKQGKYQDAKKTLRKYMEKHPHGKRVANAYFWIGECEYKLKRYEEAILEYQKVISKYQKSNKVPDSLLKQGIAFAKLGDNESAKIVLNKLIKKYPKSPQANVAKKQLTRLQ